METRQVEIDGRKVFDHRVEIREPKTGKVVAQNHYILHINKEGTRYESPPYSGKFYNPQGELIKDISAEVAAKKASEAAVEQPKKSEPVSVSAPEPQAPAAEDPVASAEAEAARILQGARNTVRKKE